MNKADGIETVPTRWRQVILVCRKCSKKLDGGFGPKGEDTLARALKQAARAAGRRGEVQVVETKCLGVCPKKAVTVVDANRPGAMLLVPAGTEVSGLV